MNIIMTNRKNKFLVEIILENKDISELRNFDGFLNIMYMQMEYPNCNISIDFDNYIRKGHLFQNTVR